MKCEICKGKVQQTFLKKIVGTYVKDKKGKKHSICSTCQNKFKNKEEILKQL
jgi:hypothetical protein